MKKYAFWYYGLYPYFLGAEIDLSKCQHDGKVYVPSYQGYFTPILILEGDEGVEMIKKMKHLEASYGEAFQDLQSEFKELLLDTVPEIKKILKTRI